MAGGLDKVTRDRLDAIADDLAVVRLDRSRSLVPIIREIRDLTELDSVGLYSLRNRTGLWEIERWEVSGTMTATQPLVARMFETARDFPLYYNPHAPPQGHRNRVLDARRWVEETRPGAWEESNLVVQVLRPIGAHQWHQPRALLCKGPALLGWFGAIDPKSPTSRQLAIMSRLVRPLRDRLDADRKLADDPYTRPALEAMLDRVGAPAFVVDARGGIQEANRSGRALLDARHGALRSALRRATVGRESAAGIELISIQDGETRAWIAVVKAETADQRIERCVDACATRWSLTPRQTQVLGHVVRGLSNATIATLLGCVERTVELHISAIFDRAGIASRAALVATVLTASP